MSTNSMPSDVPEAPARGDNKKQKAPDHAFRVGTDAVRKEGRARRAARIGGLIDVRRQASRDLTQVARFTLPRDRGFSVHGPGTFDVSNVIRAGIEATQSVDIEQKKAKANKPFMMRLLETASFTLESPFLRLGLDREIVAIASTYLGMVPILQFANVYLSSATGPELVKSQLYHCDSDDTEEVKVFVLCEAVTPDMGPLTFVRADESEVVRARTEYQYKTRLTDEQVHQALGKAPEEAALLGPAGTVAFIDTSRCFHYGSRISDPTKRRIVVMLQYVTPLAFVLPEDDFRAGARFRKLVAPDSDPLTRMVLGAD